MNELYTILSDLLDIEYNQKSLLHMLSVAEASYTMEKEQTAKLTANCARLSLEELQKELRMVISNLDGYLAEQAKESLSDGLPLELHE